MSTRARLVAAALALGLLAVACERGESARDATTPPTPPPTTESPSPESTESPEPPGTPTEEPSPTPTPELEDGRHFGYIQEVDLLADPPAMVFDLAYFLTGEEANEAAEERGDETPVPNDYYIVNDNPRLRTLIVDPSCKVFILRRGGAELKKGSLVGFAAGFEENDRLAEYHGSASQYWVTVEDGVAVEIEEQYLP